jgi:hypothetical protein
MYGIAAVFALTFLGGSLGSEKNSIRSEWDWTGIIGTGQSLSIGARALPVISTDQPYGNLKLSTDDLPWPIDPDDPKLQLVPLVEPIGRLAKQYPSGWPENIDGETPHTAAANEISALMLAASGRRMVTIHSAIGEDGQGMIYLKKGATPRGVNGRSYEAAMVETRAIARLAKSAGKSFGVGAIFVTHGETDAGNQDYEAQLYKLWSDYDEDLKAITGQKRDVLMLVSQQDSVVDYAASTLAQWRIGSDHPEHVICSGPKYQYPYFQDSVHLTAQGYQLLGEKYGQVYFERAVLGNKWEPLQPSGIVRQGKVIKINFHVPVTPLVWDSDLDPAHPGTAEWAQGKGFEVCTAAGEKVGISSAEIHGSTVEVTCVADPGVGARVSYAMVGEKTARSGPVHGTVRWGLLRDSDPFVGATSKQSQPNWCVAFELAAP